MIRCLEEVKLTVFVDGLNVESEGKRRINHDIWVIWHLFLLSTEFIPETESLVVLKIMLTVFTILLF